MIKEEFLYYVWKNQLFDNFQLNVSQKNKIFVKSPGQRNFSSGPDFFNAQIIIDDQLWAGNVEIHVKSSDWYLHMHHLDLAYQNVILHVVWDNDTPVFDYNNNQIPVLELKNFCSEQVVLNYQKLFKKKISINCNYAFSEIEFSKYEIWKEKLFLDRLDLKSQEIENLLIQYNSDWEQVLYLLLLKYFGVTQNSEVFLKMGEILPYSIIRKNLYDVNNLEALFYGVLNMLSEKECNYKSELNLNWEFLKNKYNLTETYLQVNYFKQRPDNFPTIRISQIANLLYKNNQLFQNLILEPNFHLIRKKIKVAASNYWENHYVFCKTSKNKIKSISDSFIDILMINVIIPLKYTYYKFHENFNLEELIDVLKSIKNEKNNLINEFLFNNISVNNAFDSQVFLHLRKHYCDKNRCLNCEIGLELLKK